MTDIAFVGAQTSETDTVNDLAVAMPAGLAEGDTVLVIAGTRNATDDSWSEAGGTWTKLADLFSTDSRSVNAAVFSKQMGATPDTSVTISQNGAAAGMGAVAAAWRSGDPAVAIVTTSGIDSSNANAPAVTTTLDGSVVIDLAAATCGALATLSGPAGYGDATLAKLTVTNLALMVSSKLIATAGAEDPGAYSVSTSGTSDSWVAASVVLAPAAEAAAAEPARPTGGGKGKKHKAIKRRRILLPDGRILIPATEADYRHAVEWIIALQPPQEEATEPPPAPVPLARPKTVRKAPKSPKARAVPADFYKRLDLHNSAVLYWQEISQAYAAYQAAEADEEEAVELLLLAS